MFFKRLIPFVSIIVLTASLAGAYSTNPPDNRAGNPPGNLNCTACHGSFALNSGNGQFSIDNVPTAYTMGETYTITVTIFDSGQRRWGFELTALDSNNQQAGTFLITDATNTQLSDNNGTNADFIKQRSAGTFAGTNDGPVSWSFDWTAPSEDIGTITFYAAGNAANNNGSTSGDYIYTAMAASSGPADIPLEADFSADPTEGCAPVSVEFTDGSTGVITSWDWDFGDGGSSTEQDPSHEYQTAGTYTVSLTVTGPGGIESETKTDLITVQELPMTDFSGTPTSGPTPLSVTFTDLSSGEVTSWFWDFGDGNTSLEQNPAHDYTEDGTYTVTLIVSGICGTDTMTKTDFVNVGIKTVDVAMTDGLIFDPDPVVIGTGTAVKWTTTGSAAHTSTSGTGSDDPQSGVLWDSGLLGNGESFTHFFSEPGTFPYYCIPHFNQGMTGTVIVCEGMAGDADNDGTINVLDVLTVINHILGISPFLSDCEFWQGDCNGDDVINILDALGIVRHVLGQGPCEG